MHSAGTITRTKNRLSISDAEPKFGSTKLATAAIRGALALAVLSALLLIAARPAQAQTETVLYNFTGGSDGSNPYCRLTADGAGNFYDTTPYGGLRDTEPYLSFRRTAPEAGTRPCSTTSPEGRTGRTRGSLT